jgi:hypothetical protein
MMDDRGIDEGFLAGIGLMAASAAVLLFAFSIVSYLMPSNTAIALESAASEVCGDVETVATMAIPYAAEKRYSFDFDVSVSTDYVVATGSNATFARPLAVRIVPGKYSENGTLAWNGTSAMRQYLNATFNATGTREHPIDDSRADELYGLMERASSSTLSNPVKLEGDRAVVIEKAFLYTYNGSSHTLEARPYVFVYNG